jgi:diacylglycerol kinase family enzyme
MRHLFIINPKARMIQGRIDDIASEIRAFFSNYPHFKYDIHVTRWKRDAVGYARRYVSNAAEIVRVYAVGGMGTFFEVINGIIGLPNVQVAAWPFGVNNSFLHYFGDIDPFRSLRNLVFSSVVSFDLERCGNNYSICYGLMGAEAMASQRGDQIMKNAGLLTKWSIWAVGIYAPAAVYNGLKKENDQFYRVILDNIPLHGNYISMLIANQPYYGQELHPAIDARPNDGLLDVYLIRAAPPIKMLRMAADYVRGRYYKWPHAISHFRGKTITVSSNQIMAICIDGELFYDTVISYEAVPCAVDFVCPSPCIPPDSGSPVMDLNHG